MTVGTTADFDVTRDELVRAALRKLGNVEPSNTEISEAVQALGILVRHRDAMGDHLWAVSNTESTLTLVAGQQAYATGILATTIARNILKLEYAAVLINSQRFHLKLFDKPTSLRTYLQNANNSQPLAVHLERAKLLTGNRMLFYATPDSAYTVVYNFRRPLYDFDSLSDNPDFPSEFIKPLVNLLAYDLSPEYGTAIAERQQLLSDGERAWEQAIAFNQDKPAHLPLRTEYF